MEVVSHFKMKIIKSFDDFEFFDQMVEGPNDSQKDRWTWGLGDDGDLYFQWTESTDSFKWRAFKNAIAAHRHLSLRVMKRLVKEFGHLLVFL